MTFSPRQYFLPTLRTLILKTKSDDSLNSIPADFPDPVFKPFRLGFQPAGPLPEGDVDSDAEDRPREDA